MWNCPTLITSQVRWLGEVEYQALLARPKMRLRSPEALEAIRDRQRDSHFRGLQPGDYEAVQASIAIKKRFVAALHRAGAGLLAGTDVSNRMPLLQGASLLAELAHFVDAGLTPYEAIKAATRDSAEFLNAQDDFGTVAVARRADLILTEENPLEEVGNTAKQVGVMVHGRWYPKEELQAKLDVLAEKYAKQRSEQAGEDATKSKLNEKERK